MKIDDLVKELKSAAAAYYGDGESSLSDAEFDSKVAELRQLDPNNEFLKSVGAPVIGTTVKHVIPMGSTDKSQSFEELERFCKRATGPWVVQYKLDGSSLSVEYKNGKFISATTRGDGKTGEAVGTNVAKMQNVPQELPNNFTGHLRGEAILSIKTFNEVFVPLRDKDHDYKNPRNVAAGLVRNQKVKDAELQKHLKVIFYDVVTNKNFVTETDRISYIQNLGLEVVQTEFIHTPQAIWDIYKKFEQERKNLDYECDGVIIRYNDLKTQKELGTSSDSRPKWMSCLKYENETAETTLLDVLVTIAHTGAMVPTGMLNPVQVGGVTISNVLLNNYDYVKELGLTKGCKLIIERAGGVIPHIQSVLTHTDTPINPPEKCISCGGKLTKDGVHWLCTNEDCDGVGIRKVKSWITKRGI